MTRDPEATKRVLMEGKPHICPSLLNCTFARLEDEINDAERCGAKVIHWDVMDGEFVPNFTYGPPIIASLRDCSKLVFDTHLMMSHPEKYLDAFVEAGCDTLTIHLEAVPEPGPLLKRIRSAGVLAGLAINPPMPIEAVEPWLDDADIILVMSVMPGFGGQKFDPRALDKMSWLREHSPQTLVEVDGGVNRHTIADATKAGANMMVVGSAFYSAADRQGEFAELARLMHSN